MAITRQQYIDHYRKHYRTNGKRGAGAGLGMKAGYLKRVGYTDEMTLLDYGCGWGAILEGINPKDYLGVDIVPEAIELAKEHFPKRRFKVLEMGKLRTTPKDMAIALSVFTHARYEDAPVCLRDIKRNLKQSGIALLDILEGERSENIHFRHYPKEDFEKLLEEAGLVSTDHFWIDAESGFRHLFFVLKHR